MARRDTGNRTIYWQSQRIPGLSLLRADLAAHEFAPHTHDAFVIAVTEAGGAEISSRGTTEQVGAATLFVSNPEERQSARMDRDQRWLYRAFYLTHPAIDAVGSRLGMQFAPYFMRNMPRRRRAASARRGRADPGVASDLPVRRRHLDVFRPARRASEADALTGAIVAAGERHGVLVPLNGAPLALLRATSDGLRDDARRERR
ncbi:AraC family ligand binding domain-containing protein [Bradyrhizobium sp. BWA-3-5]|uniref:AraC family ligand binding domain-containing protein n=1 Tax=Bradyrhizobium sp. BWA-3-5 TaxID=3080013 RepID=UPI00293E3BEF|nr:AraC family ligand binding domain-containing protein [Bradyrhizobium sp. BWA-3-5]WOH66850.1 AraC family ligand binding domain-containing protein [Bradyrhizobium sp. BWA-3-5]